jgi:hypothetical protein
MADVFTVLGQDHQEVKRMLAAGEGPTRITGASEDQPALRKKMTEQLIIEESGHEALEETYFWPVVRDHLPDGDTLADQAAGQEREAKEVLAKLDKLDAGHAEFEKLLGTFIRAAREHIRFEATAVWITISITAGFPGRLRDHFPDRGGGVDPGHRVHHPAHAGRVVCSERHSASSTRSCGPYSTAAYSRARDRRTSSAGSTTVNRPAGSPTW